MLHRDRKQGREWDGHNNKQWILVTFPVSDQCEHFCIEPIVAIPVPLWKEPGGWDHVIECALIN